MSLTMRFIVRRERVVPFQQTMEIKVQLKLFLTVFIWLYYSDFLRVKLSQEIMHLKAILNPNGSAKQYCTGVDKAMIVCLVLALKPPSTFLFDNQSITIRHSQWPWQSRSNRQGWSPPATYNAARGFHHSQVIDFF